MRTLCSVCSIGTSLLVMLLGFSAGCSKQKETQTTSNTPAANAPAPERSAIPPGTPEPGVIHQKLKVFVYPANKQSSDQQQYDEMDCYNWAKSQTSIDPMGRATAAQQVAKEDASTSGMRAKGAARGAAKGAMLGAITGNAGRGAAVGATVGTVRGGRAKRAAEADAEQQYQQAQAQAQKQAAGADQAKINTFKKAFSACVQGRGYSVQ